MTALPPANYIDQNSRTKGEDKVWREQLRAFVAEGEGSAPETELTIASGSITPTAGVHSIDTEGDEASDNLDTIAQTNLADGRTILIRPQDNARAIVVRNGQGGSGQIFTRTGLDVTLRNTSEWLRLVRRGTAWYEVQSALGDAEVDVAAASTTAIGAASSRNVRITGTTTITSFGAAPAGLVCNVRCADALTLTHNATSLILPGLANITTAVGDGLTAVSLGAGNWKVLLYQRQNGGVPNAVLTALATVMSSTATAAAQRGAMDVSGLKSIQVFTASGTWTRPAGITRVIVEVRGSGGGGGAATGGAGVQAGAGGGQGGYACKIIDASAISSETVTVGNGGNGGGAGGDGLTGGTVSFGAHCSATGGAGGVGGATANPARGGAGGTGSGGSFNLKGQAGTNAHQNGIAGTGGGQGGGRAAVSSDGESGNMGGGGGGAVADSGNPSGGGGGKGYLIVWEYN